MRAVVTYTWQHAMHARLHPVGGGARKCIGDQFALFEATVALAMLLRRFTFELAVPADKVSVGAPTSAELLERPGWFAAAVLYAWHANKPSAADSSRPS